MEAQMYRVDKVKVQRLMLDKFSTVEQRILAQHMDVQEASLSRLLAGGGFRAEMLTKLCQALECTPNDILTFVPDEPEGAQGAPRSHTQAKAPTQTKKILA
jgi:putative transcriptional regulator